MAEREVPRLYCHGQALPECPAHRDIADEHVYPITLSIYSLWIATGFGFAIATQVLFNAVLIFEKRVRNRQISNTYWIIFFICMALRGLVGVIRYSGAVATHHQWMDFGFFIAGAVAQGLSNLFFALSLKHQLSYRQYPTSNFSLNTEALVERQPLLNPSAAVSNKPKCQLNIGDALCIFLFIGYTVALCVQALGRRFVIELYYAHLACLAALQLAQVWFWYAVVTYKGKFRPSYSSRILLSVGVTLSLFNVLPPMVWQTELPGDCVLQWFSWIDVMLLLDATSMLFVFLFLMAEYRRLREVMLYRAYASLHQSISFKT